MLMSAEKSQLLVIDIQDRLLPVMADPAAVVKAATILLQAAARLKLPVTISEQYPKGIGPTVAEVTAAADGAKIIEKLAFSCLREPKLEKPLLDQRGRGRPQVVLLGIEAHVCVLQTALDLKDRGFDVFVVADGISARMKGSVDIALSRMAHAGVVPVTTEMVVFEWLDRAGTDDFKALSKLIK